ncbi:hypothetical protein [Cryobacterium sp. Sr3]|uniref:hypothetical protein n=1 Tax=Cryobacterium sp. Sr3 TaxID=1259194 RepID=UPI00106B5062|nr:hypothetical protein [Cryobacterium sp. Sr3]TFB59629.1 hypothetical protein E3N94_03220 [Cryobacterium sp. Sr3]
MDATWTSELAQLANEKVILYFGSWNRLPRGDEYERESYPWDLKKRGMVGDSRVHAKNNIEYHTVEDHAFQYHVSARFEEAFHHWLIAAAHRIEDTELIGRDESTHNRAIEFCIREALYNRALHEMQTAKEDFRDWPLPQDFGIALAHHERGEAKAESALNTVARPVSRPTIESGICTDD